MKRIQMAAFLGDKLKEFYPETNRWVHIQVASHLLDCIEAKGMMPPNCDKTNKHQLDHGYKWESEGDENE